MPAAQASKTRTEFLLVADPALGLESNHIPLENGRWTIGSGDENRIVAKGSGVEEQHCLILVRSGQLLMKSWGQQTLVNGQESGEALLEAGDVLTLGESDFQIRHEGPTESEDQAESITDRIETLSGIVEELDEELSGRLSNVDRLDATISRIQAKLENGAASGSAVARLRSQIDVLQESVAAESVPKTEAPEVLADASDLRVEAAQQNLDQILDGFEESELSRGTAAYELQLSLRVEQQLRQLETVSTSLESRATVLEQQALELQGQRNSVPHGPFEEQPAQAADSSFEGRQVTADESIPPQDGHDDLSVPDASDSSAQDAALSEDALHSYVSEQRQKLQMLMDDFEPLQTPSGRDEEVTVSESVLEEIRTTLENEAALEGECLEVEEHSESEIREAVTAAVIDGSSQLGEVTAAKRSRDEAIRQLDDLIRIAADESQCDVPTPSLPDARSVGPEGYSTISNFDAVSGADTVVEGEMAWATPDSIEIDFDDDSASEAAPSESSTEEQIDEASSTEDSIEATFDFATEQLAAFSEEDEHESDPHDRTLTELEFETGAASQLVEAGLTAEDAVEEDAVEEESEFPPGFSWATESVTADPDDVSAEQTGEGDAASDEADIEDTWREGDGEIPQSSTASIEEPTGSDEADSEAATDAGNEPAEDDGSESPEGRVQELRAQLAQMFDLPEDDSSAADPEASKTEAAAPEPGLWESTLANESDAESSSDDSAGQDASRSETGDELTTDAPPLETETGAEAVVEPAEPSSDASHEAEESDEGNVDDPNSIDAYMQQLLARNRQQVGGAAMPELVPSRPEPEKETSSAPARTSAKSDDDQSDDQTTWLTEGPRHRQDRDAVRASLTTLREVANQSARSAVAQAGRSQLRREILTLTAASLICLVFAVVAGLLKVNPLLPLGAVGVSLFFAVKLGIEIRRSSALLRQARANSDDEKSDSRSAISPDEVIMETEVK